MQSILKVLDLSKSFGTNKAVDKISFEVEAGSFFAFLGQNGAGKSTTINMLIGLLEHDGGEFFYADNKSVEQFKSQIGVVFQSNVFDDMLTVKENLQLFGTFYLQSKPEMQKRYKEIILMFGLEQVENQRFGTLSGGQKRKAEMARAMFSSPKILFLDEPTTGLDPKTRIEVWNILHGLRKETGMTLFLTTHYMEETAQADRVVIIHKGKRICEGSPSELKARYSFDNLFIVPKDECEFEKALKARRIAYEKTADNYAIRIKDTIQSIDLLSVLKDEIRFYEVKKGSMDDVFMAVVGESIKGNSEV